MDARPSNSIGNGGMVIRKSCNAIETARAASPRSWASMKLANSARMSRRITPLERTAKPELKDARCYPSRDGRLS